ncbi:protein TSSC4 [Microplitis demolitor]|uniref:protein TSSC4 n=1 Tax=Microplitis demolitor TaxID=69319 RepID=UPI0004CCF346|nr:protein TSSC4 [Microplitis demolitor]
MKVPTTSFQLQSDKNSAFYNRQQALFDQLSQAEKNCKKDQSTPIDTSEFEREKFRRPPPPGKRRKNEARQFRGKESIFKQASLPSPFSDRSIPDYHKNPHKWMRYSLDDVADADMSEKNNTRAALSFLKELKARKLKDELNEQSSMQVDDDKSTGMSSSTSSSIIKFKKPKCKEQSFTEIVEPDNAPIFIGSKIILPEYVVGQKPINKSKKDKKNFVKVDRSKQMKLDHLQEYEDE